MQLKDTEMQVYGAIMTPLEAGDYFLITLPTQTSVSGTSLTCTFNNPAALKVEACTALSPQKI